MSDSSMFFPVAAVVLFIGSIVYAFYKLFEVKPVSDRELRKTSLFLNIELMCRLIRNHCEDGAYATLAIHHQTIGERFQPLLDDRIFNEFNDADLDAFLSIFIRTAETLKEHDQHIIFERLKGFVVDFYNKASYVISDESVQRYGEYVNRL